MAKTFTTLFSGAGGVDLGLISAGFEPCESVEYDPQLAELHKANIGGKMHVMNILDCDPYRFEKIDLLHASPVCKSYSTANAAKGEKQLDIDCAIKTAKFIKVLQPPIFTLENVQAYLTAKDNKAFKIILEKLYKLGYWVNYQVLNAADFSVPQSRRRLILVALKRNLISDSDIIQSGDIRLVKNSLEKGSLINVNQLALFDTPKSLVFEFDRIPDVNDESLKYLFKQGFYAAIVNNKFIMINGENVPSLPPKEKHIGWYEAIKDKVHDLPDSDLALWQVKRLNAAASKDQLLIPSLLLGGANKSQSFLDFAINNRKSIPAIRDKELPCFTIPSDISTQKETRAILINESSTMECRQSHEPSATQVASPRNLNQKAILIENTGARSDRELQTRADDEPCWTLRAMGRDGHYHRANALLIHPTEQRSDKPFKYPDEPCHTILANHGGENIEALLENAKIKALDIACLAALQSFPPDYIWSGVKSVDGKGIGNSVCPLKYRKIVERLW